MKLVSKLPENRPSEGSFFFLGVAIIFSDLLREGGWPVVGVPVAIIGLVDAVFSPRILKKIWERQ